MNPLVSVVVPVFNSEKTIQACLDSIFGQTYGDLEIILINDGSTDGSERIIKQNKAKKTLPVVYSKQDNQGVSAARNAGMKIAKGKYVAFLDSDDIWDRDKIKTQMDIMENDSNIDLLATNKNGAKFQNLFGHGFKKITPITLKMMLYKNFLLTSTVVLKREVLNKGYCFDENMRHSEDMDFFFRISAQFNCFLYNKSLVDAWGGKPSYGHSGLSANLLKMEKGELRSIKKIFSLKKINFFEYVFFCNWSFIKFVKRYISTLVLRLK